MVADLINYLQLFLNHRDLFLIFFGEIPSLENYSQNKLSNLEAIQN